MNLAWQEIKFNKRKYFLIEAILILMIFMVLFLSGLANGLSRAVGSSIENMDVEYFVLNKDSENLITVSNLSPELQSDIESKTSSAVTPLSILRLFILTDNSSDRLDITYISIDPKGFLVPKITSGENLLESDFSIILDESYKDDGVKLGDTVIDSNTKLELKVVGFTKGSYYGHVGAGYINERTYTKIKSELSPSYVPSYQAFAIKSNDISKIDTENIDIVDKETVVTSIPGYKAEQTTINMILWVLLIVSAAILGVFFYIITIQKKNQFGVMKAIGMGMKQLNTIILSQVLILSLFGTVAGNILVFAMSAAMPSSMPFYLTLSSALFVSSVFVVISTLCSLISTAKIAKVDPIITIGGGE